MVPDSLPVIPAGEYPARWLRVQRLMAELGLDLLIAYADDRAVFGPAHARWLGNFPVHFEPACILLARDRDPVLLTGPESVAYALRISVIGDVRATSLFVHPDEDYPYAVIHWVEDVLAEAAAGRPIRRVGLAGQGLMPTSVRSALVDALPLAELLDVESPMCDLRAVKSPAEISVIRYAYRIAQSGFSAAVRAIRAGATEREVAAAADAEMRQCGAEGVGIDTIVASGPNSGPILARSTFRRIAANDMVLVTVAPRYEGYHAAIGRPVFVGAPNAQAFAAFEVARRAQEACFSALKPGIRGSDVEAAGRRIVAEAGLGRHFLYSGLHSVGVIEFEPPILGPSSNALLREGMVVSVDIPLFDAPWGGLRIEDGYLITECGAERLNDTPHLLTIS